MGRILILRDSRGEYRVTIGENGCVSIDGVTMTATVSTRGEEIEVQPEGRRRRAAVGHGSLSAPMPATVVRVEVSPGTAVRRGDTLVILEAMKMELPIRASSDGIVKVVHCKPGDLVQPGIALIDIE